MACEYPSKMLTPTKIYKFRPISPKYPAYVSRILTHNELYFPSAPQLNDPWECRPLVRMSAEYWSDIGEDGVIRPVPSYLLRDDPTGWLGQTKTNVEGRSIMTEKVGLEKHRRRSISRSRASITSVIKWTNHMVAFKDLYQTHPTFRLCSFAGNAKHPLLWSHYSDSHAGLCIELLAWGISLTSVK
jgi:hypothetical protein